MLAQPGIYPEWVDENGLRFGQWCNTRILVQLREWYLKLGRGLLTCIDRTMLSSCSRRPGRLLGESMCSHARRDNAGGKETQDGKRQCLAQAP